MTDDDDLIKKALVTGNAAMVAVTALNEKFERSRADGEKKISSTDSSDADGKLDKVLAGIDSLCSRMDAHEKRLGLLEGKHRRDADDDEEDGIGEEGAEKALERDEREMRGDSEPRSRARAYSDAQENAQKYFSAWGLDAPYPLPNESLLAYQKRCVSKLQDKCSDKDLRKVDVHAQDRRTFPAIQNAVYADAYESSKTRFDKLAPGVIVPVQHRDQSGRMITEFRGSGTFIRKFNRPARKAVFNMQNLNAMRNASDTYSLIAAAASTKS